MRTSTSWRDSTWPVLSAAALCMLCQTASAGEAGVKVYECTENGVTTFSDIPCGQTERPVVVDYPKPDATTVEAAEARIRAEDAETDAYLAKIELNRAISQVEGRISDLQKQRDAELEALRGQMVGAGAVDTLAEGSPATNASAVVAEQIADANIAKRMEAVNERYAEDISVQQQRLQTLLQRQAEVDPTRMERRELGPQQ